MKTNRVLLSVGVVVLLLVIAAAGIIGTVLVLGTKAEAAPSQAKKNNQAIGSIRTDGQTIVCGPFHEPLVIAGVPVSYSEGYLSMQDGYMLEVAPFSFYSGKFMGLQIDPETREVTRSILVGDEDYYPCPQQTASGG